MNTYEREAMALADLCSQVARAVGPLPLAAYYAIAGQAYRVALIERYDAVCRLGDQAPNAAQLRDEHIKYAQGGVLLFHHAMAQAHAAQAGRHTGCDPQVAAALGALVRGPRPW